MANILNAITTGVGGIATTADSSGEFAFKKDGVTLATISASGVIADSSAVLRPLVSGTAVASTSGTSIDFTSIPSWVKRITIMLSAVSTNGNANLRVQLGDSGGVETTGYSSMSGWIGASSASSGSSSGFDGYGDSGASTSRYGMYVFTTLGSNIWTCSAQYTSPNQNFIYCVSGGKTLSDVLDRVRITTSNGTDTFDSGSINILYE